MNTETGAVGTRRNIYQNCTVFQTTFSLWLQDPAKKTNQLLKNPQLPNIVLSPSELKTGVEFNAPLDTIQVILEGGLHNQSLDWYWQTKQYGKIHKLNITQKANNAKYSRSKLPWFSCHDMTGNEMGLFYNASESIQGHQMGKDHS